ncbi:MAG: serine hydroxymethyltransferase [Bacilli bacterium]|jgi:glycine hydroxymethyltransferase|nr:serine hydroxymethyltransferase [Bacilli bacterium]
MDREIEDIFALETKRQNEGIELICSENYPSKETRLAMSSIMVAKYAEGFPGHRYYGGCEFIDRCENLCIERLKALFGAKFANVQPHSGSQANFAAYHALINPGETVLSLELNDGGHLTHGSPVSFSSQMYHFVHYPLGEDAHLDYGIVEKCLDEYDPNLFLAGYSAYPYAIDFKRMRELIDEHNAHSSTHCLFMVDMAHIAGIIAAGYCQNPCDYADLVTSTTHKTLRGPRGGVILTNDPDIAKRVDKAVFPYSQGGPLENIIAAKAVAFREDAEPSFKTYIKKVLDNTKACNDELAHLGATVSGTDNHLFLLNVLKTYGITGKEAQLKLESVGVTTNKNMIHGDTLKPAEASGVRIGFAAVTTRGCTKEQAVEIADLIDGVLKDEPLDVAYYSLRVKAIASTWKDVAELSF